MHKMILRGVGLVAALSIPAALGIGGIASADTFGNSATSAGPQGVTSSQIDSGTTWDGSYYIQHWNQAGPTGASSASVTSISDHGYTSYDQRSSQAGPTGASSSDVHSSTGDSRGGNWHSWRDGHEGGLLGVLNILR